MRAQIATFAGWPIPSQIGPPNRRGCYVYKLLRIFCTIFGGPEVPIKRQNYDPSAPRRVSLMGDYSRTQNSRDDRD
jgi:hypothetical protein